MAYENLCMYCFKDLRGSSICPHCGKDARAAVPQIQMLPGTPVYRDRFLLGRALGQDANGIVYTALDTRKGGTIRIREYLPRNCAERLNDGTVVPLAGMEDAFEAGMRKLRASVESVEDPKKRHFYFEENGTAYIAQRKNVRGVPEPEDDDVDDARGHSRSVVIYIAIAAIVVLLVAGGIIWFLSSMSDPDDVTIQPLPTVSAEATWMPEATPSPTPYATPTFAALKDPELTWMDYTYSGDVESEYEKQQSTVQVTKKPTIITEEDYSTINSSSKKATITELQEKLVNLGWLYYSDVTGRYDSATKEAVKDFQRYVNDYCSPAKKLAVDGIAGEKTQQWLYNSSVSLSKPTPTPKPLVTAAPDNSVVDASSSKREIRALQEQLIFLGFMEEGSADGKYGSTTKSAVKSFQIRVNKLQGYDALDITGTVDELTQAYLEYYVQEWEKHLEAENGKDEPTPAPTESGTVNATSSKARITAVQEMLRNVGLLDEWDVDGVYSRGTINAVKEFQKWVNEQRDELVLDVSGECDALTLRYLEYCVEKNMTVSQPTATPTAKPTATPEPEVKDDEIIVSPDSERESIAFVQEMLATVGMLDESDIDGSYGKKTVRAVQDFQRFINDNFGAGVEENGLCDALTIQYMEQAYSEGWNLGEAEDEPTPTPKPTATPEPEVDEANETINASSSKAKIRAVQEMLAAIGLLDESDIDGDYGRKTRSAVETLQQFVNDQKGSHELDLTGECNALTRRYLEYCYEKGWNVGEAVRPDEPDPTEPPYVEPEQPDEPEATPEPELGNVRGFSVTIDGNENDGRLIELDTGRHSIQWTASEGVESFFVYLYDSDGDLINSKTGTGEGEISVKASDLKEGEIYRLEIGALPLNGTEDDIIWQTVQLTRFVPDEPDPTEVPKAQVSKPSISIGSPAHQEDGVPYISGDTVIFSWMADGDVDYYNAKLVYEDGTSYSLGDTNETSKTVSSDQLQPGLWKLYVGAMPIGGSEDDMKWNELLFGVPEPEIPDEPTREPDPDPGRDPEEKIEFIDETSDPEDIQLVQMALYKFGLINSDEAELGVLDEATIEAVILFQQLMNEQYDMKLEVMDPEVLIAIDMDTLEWLLYQELDLKTQM